jgi:HlyD family secretion protein
MVGIWSDVRKDVSNQDSFAIKQFLVDKLAVAVFELADHGSVHGTVVAAGDIKVPLEFVRVQPYVSPRIELSNQRQEKVDLRVSTSCSPETPMSSSPSISG